MAEHGAPDYDPMLDPAVARLAAQLDRLTTVLRDTNTTTQTTTVHHQGVPALLTAVAIGVCFSSMIFSITIAIWCFNISAWQDVMRGKIAKIEAQLQPVQPRN